MPYTTTDQHASGMSAKQGGSNESPTLAGVIKAICGYLGKSEKRCSS
ncbi:MAG: hypothetical protein FWD79_08935 [Desulfobulbus sp.]|nr:hypothetical protein [Desulfobulbus sp.]